MIRVLLVDDQRLMRSGFRALLDLEDDIEVVAEAGDGLEGLALAGVHVVILTNYGFDEYVFDALRAGAAGFLVKDIVPEDLLHSVRVAARGAQIADHMAISPATAKTHIDRAITKLHARDRAQLVVLAYESGLVTPRSP